MVFWTQASVKCMRVPCNDIQVLEVFLGLHEKSDESPNKKNNNIYIIYIYNINTSVISNLFGI